MCGVKLIFLKGGDNAGIYLLMAFEFNDNNNNNDTLTEWIMEWMNDNNLYNTTHFFKQKLGGVWWHCQLPAIPLKVKIIWRKLNS